MSLLWINGQLVDKSEARVSPFDHGFLYGDGVWEHFRVFGGKLFRPEAHFPILFDAARVLSLDIPFSQSELHAAIESTVIANSRTESYVRVIFSRGPGTIGPDPRKIDTHIFIIAEEYQPFPRELVESGLHAVIASVRQDFGNQFHRTRVLGQPQIVLAKMHALQHGCLEAILTDSSGCVTGCIEGNLLLVKQGEIVVAPCIPLDVAASTAMSLAMEAEIPLRPHAFQIDDVFAADEAFLAGTSCGIIGIVQIDDKRISCGTEGPITRRIREVYRKLTRGE